MKPVGSQTTAWRIVARAVPAGKLVPVDILEAP